MAVFDADPHKVGSFVGDYQIRAASSAGQFIRDNNIRLAVLAVPGDVAQDVADDLVNAGVEGLLNFAPVALIVPPGVALNSVDLAVQLEQLSFHVSFSEISRRAKQGS